MIVRRIARQSLSDKPISLDVIVITVQILSLFFFTQSAMIHAHTHTFFHYTIFDNHSTIKIRIVFHMEMNEKSNKKLPENKKQIVYFKANTSIFFSLKILLIRAHTHKLSQRRSYFNEIAINTKTNEIIFCE